MATLGRAFATPASQFDLERNPQRVVHTRVVGAHAFFEVYEPLADLSAGRLTNPLMAGLLWVRQRTDLGAFGPI